MESPSLMASPLLLSKSVGEDHSSSSASVEEEDNSQIKQVAMTVSTGDDPTLPVLTFRMWVLGTLSCVLLAFLNQFFRFRKEPLTITAVSAQIAVVPLGHLMASTITNRVFFKATRWEFTLNPGPFNVKEHVLITIFANSGAGTVWAIDIVTTVKVFYKEEFTFFVALLVVITSQVMGFGWAGIFRRYLVEPAEMWWPANLVQVSLFRYAFIFYMTSRCLFFHLNHCYNCRALHEKEERRKGGLTKTQFFLIAFVCSFSYYVLPGYLFPMLTSVSWICWVFPKSVFAQQLGSGLKGLGLAAFGLDWSTISSYLGSPLASPWFATANVAVGFVLMMYVLIPITYWFNVYNAKTFPIFSDGLFTSTGQHYNITSIINGNFNIDIESYEQNGPLYLSTFFSMSYGIGFASITATIVHVIVFHGREIWQQSKSAFKEKNIDIHTRLMKRYDQVPDWWFLCILVSSIAMITFACENYSEQLQFPWWGALLACCLAIFFTLPIGIITATTNQTPTLNIIAEYIMGYLYPGRPVANICFKVYGYISMKQAVTFLQDFKLGHYMKIPPRAMFTAQVVGTIVAGFVYLGTSWWLINSITNICDTSMLPANSPWTCPGDHVFYDASVIWGLVGPRRIFGSLGGTYQAVNWFFLAGAVAPCLVWLAHKAFPNQDWIRLIHMPVMIGSLGVMPPATAVNYTSWIIVGFLSGFVVYRFRQDWWRRHNYVLSGAMDAGLAFMAVLLYMCLELEDINLNWWGNNLDGCPLASCPTAKGIVVQGCPVS